MGLCIVPMPETIAKGDFEAGKITREVFEEVVKFANNADTNKDGNIDNAEFGKYKLSDAANTYVKSLFAASSCDFLGANRK